MWWTQNRLVIEQMLRHGLLRIKLLRLRSLGRILRYLKIIEKSVWLKFINNVNKFPLPLLNWFTILGFGVNGTQLFLSEYEAPKQSPFILPEIAHVAIAIFANGKSANFGFVRRQNKNEQTILIFQNSEWVKTYLFLDSISFLTVTVDGQTIFNEKTFPLFPEYLGFRVERRNDEAQFHYNCKPKSSNEVSEFLFIIIKFIRNSSAL